MFTVWTLSARFSLGVKSNDSRNGVADAIRISGADLNAGVGPGGEREAAFSSVARRIPRNLGRCESLELTQHVRSCRDEAWRDGYGRRASRTHGVAGATD